MMSLRALGRLLQVSHSSLSKAASAGRLTRGLRRDAAGRLVVADADAAIAEWREVHTPMERMPPAAGRRPPAPADALAVEFYDQHFDRAITAGELFEERDTASLLVTALAAIVLDDATSTPLGGLLHGGANPGIAEVTARVAAKLRAVAELHDADAAAIARAELELQSVIDMLTADVTDSSSAPPTE